MTRLEELYSKYPIRNQIWSLDVYRLWFNYNIHGGFFMALTDPWNRKFPTPPVQCKADKGNFWQYVTTVEGMSMYCRIPML
jgi:hypothetical protein